MKKVIVEMKASVGLAMKGIMGMDLGKMAGFTMDQDYGSVPMSPPEDMVASLESAKEEIVLVRGEVDEEKEEELKALPNVIDVWTDSQIEAFGEESDEEGETDIEGLTGGCEGCSEEAEIDLQDLDEDYYGEGEIDLEGLEEELASEGIPAFDLELAPSPCPPTDCAYTVPKGTIADVAKYLRCDRLWAKGVRGQGIVIGICDSGVSKAKVSAVIGGWSPYSGYKPGDASPGSHGTMCATDAMGMCPDAKIYDIAILRSAGVSGAISNAIKAFQWAIEQYKKTKKPQILSNSWGMFAKSWAPDYATNPNHPFTKKVVEAINTGIIVTFAAGNCGQVCPSSKCGASDTGPGRSIWGANGHPKVITVGAANILEQWIGYTSQGPAALDKKKPDFCAPSHFKGATSSDNGTSAACPVCAGVIGLLKSKDANLKQDKVKEALQKTAKNLCGPGWDIHSGYGMIQAENAYNHLFAIPTPIAHAMWIKGTNAEVQVPSRMSQVVKRAARAIFVGKPGTSNMIHLAIPTPVIIDNRRLRLDNVTLSFFAYPGTFVTSVYIYDGPYRIALYGGLKLTGSNLFRRFDAPNRPVRYGIGISIGVRFGKSTSIPPRLDIFSAGADFIR